MKSKKITHTQKCINCDKVWTSTAYVPSGKGKVAIGVLKCCLECGGQVESPKRAAQG